MNHPELDLLRRAQQGDLSAAGQLLERYRPYLKMLAHRGLDQQLQARLDPSDVVQQTMLEAHRYLDGFRGAHQEELLAWLRRILENNVAQVVQRHIVAQKRSVRRERKLLQGDTSGRAWQPALIANNSSPSQRVMRGEAAVRLAQAVDDLPPDQSEAIRLRHIEGLPLAEIAIRLDRSPMAVAGLIKRGLRGLRKKLD